MLGTKRFDLTPKQSSSLDDHVNRLIYWGTIATDKLLEILKDFSDEIHIVDTGSTDNTVRIAKKYTSNIT